MGAEQYIEIPETQLLFTKNRFLKKKIVNKVESIFFEKTGSTENKTGSQIFN